jgi:hypothetical protein
MATIELLRSLGGPEDAFEVAGASPTGPDAWAADLRARVTPDFAVRLLKPSADPRVWVLARVEIPPEVVRLVLETHAQAAKLAPEGAAPPDLLSSAALEIEEARAGTLTCRLEFEGEAASAEIRVVIYDDGFSRHTLNAAVLEIERARRALVARLDLLLKSARFAVQTQQEREERWRRETEEAAARHRDAQATAPAGAQPHAEPPLPAPGHGDIPPASPPLPPSPGPTLIAPRPTLPPVAQPPAVTMPPPAGPPPAHSTARRCPNPQCREIVAFDKRFCTVCGTPMT